MHIHSVCHFVLAHWFEVLWMVLKSELIYTVFLLMMASLHFFISINGTMLPSVCYTVLYMVRVGLGLG